MLIIGEQRHKMAFTSNVPIILLININFAYHVYGMMLDREIKPEWTKAVRPIYGQQVLTGENFMILHRMKIRGKRLIGKLFSRKDGWAWVAFAFGLCLGGVLLSMAFDTEKSSAPIFPALLSLFVLWSMAVLVLAVLACRAKTQASYDLDLARDIINATTAHMGEVRNMVETARILRHDCKHHLHVVQILLETGRIQEAREYLLAFGTKCDEGTVPQFCSNPAVNALLVGYQKRCRDEGIEFSAVVDLVENPAMDNFELCTLFGNLLENAWEACKKAPEAQRSIILKSVPHGSQLLISVKNTFDGTVVEEEGHIVSRKGASGGLGIKSIRAIAGRHQGEYVPKWEGHTFTANVMIRL